tara:strand:- start:559 stop:690 length:132 start_codon:yes stop_codon:yes gene_type:complete
MLLVEALLLLIDSLIVVTAIMIIPIAIGMFIYNNSDEFRLDDE